ncbi:MAG: hypothetical protein JW860_09395 [Sedimentisphaerales bacterium]|nr:hypothetical protein [Sedimentisphaerales bacterium]
MATLIAGIITAAVIVFHALFLRKPRTPASSAGLSMRWDGLRKLCGVFMLLSFLALAVTGFYAGLIKHEPLTGYLLMFHVSVGPVFIVCLTMVALLSAARYCFSGCCCENVPEETSQDTGTGTGSKLCFWLMMLTALPLALSIVLSMFNLFGTEGQRFLYDLHRCSSIVMCMVYILFLYFCVINPLRYK